MWVDVVVEKVVEVVRVCRRVWMEERDEKEGRADRSSRSICFTVGTDRPFLSQASRDARRRERGRQAGRKLGVREEATTVWLRLLEGP